MTRNLGPQFAQFKAKMADRAEQAYTRAVTPIHTAILRQGAAQEYEMHWRLNNVERAYRESDERREADLGHA